MPLIWRGAGSPPCWFPPDRMENIRHDAKDNENIMVLSAKGVPVCGRVVDGAARIVMFRLRPEWVWMSDRDWEVECMESWHRLQEEMFACRRGLT